MHQPNPAPGVNIVKLLTTTHNKPIALMYLVTSFWFFMAAGAMAMIIRAELCGEKHAAMNFSVLAVSPEEYEDYISDLRSNPANRIGTGAGSGQPRNAEEVAEQIAGSPS